MKPFSSLVVSGAIVTASLGLAACGSSNGHAAAKASASAAIASAKASLKNNPQLQSDLTDAYTALSACAKSQEGLIVTIPIPDSGEKPTVSQVSLKVVRHPVNAFKKIVACTPEGQAGGKKAISGTEQIVLNNGIGHHILSKDFTDVAYFLATGKKLAQ
jgi:hypothetical protein